MSFQILVNTWSTFCEAPFEGQHDRAERGNHAAALDLLPDLSSFRS
jgi:hypothetical protein